MVWAKGRGRVLYQLRITSPSLAASCRMHANSPKKESPCVCMCACLRAAGCVSGCLRLYNEGRTRGGCLWHGLVPSLPALQPHYQHNFNIKGLFKAIRAWSAPRFGRIYSRVGRQACRYCISYRCLWAGEGLEVTCIFPPPAAHTPYGLRGVLVRGGAEVRFGPSS
ncbi:hypothetical protein LY78DRAFT_275219 [Colletotrichum sublineola]|nr:hypothetical protein LY78DRAFT_275219 [Colletotrichum sublineola]